MSIAVKSENLSKKYGLVEAVKGVSFETKGGEIFGIIGADGAGKTTLIRMLTTLALPVSGRAFVMGFDAVEDFKKIRGIIGYMPGVFSLYGDLSVEENLSFFAAVYGTTIKDNYEMIKDIYSQIEPFKHRKARALSGGMKQKLALCCALVHSPDVLFLDEPTTGVDPVSRREFWEILKKLQKGGLTVLVSTPYMDEATLCDRIALMHEGSFLAVDTPTKIAAAFDKPLFSLQGGIPGEMLYKIREFEGTRTCFAFGDSYHITFKNGYEPLQLGNFLQTKGLENPQIDQINAGIEDCFMEFLK